MLERIEITTGREGFYDITRKIGEIIETSGIKDGIAVIWCPHTTAGITINENSDPDVETDFFLGMRETFPESHEYRHDEGNSPAHIKSSMVGAGTTLIIENGRLLLGRWQAVYFAEFDGPRERSCYVKLM